jgi:hypothetical protein
MKLFLAISAALSLPAQAALPEFIFHNSFDDPSSCSVPGLTRAFSSDITYGAFTNPVRYAVSVVEWNNIWGHFNANDGVTPWPGVNGTSPVLQDFRRSNFLAAHFRTGTNTSRFGSFYTTYANSPNIDMAISRQCGDFTYVEAGCIQTNVPRNAERLGTFTFATNNATKCILQPNTDYWVNMKYTNQVPTSGCPSGAEYCPLPSLIQLN